MYFTGKEIDILRLWQEGYDLTDISEKLGVSIEYILRVIAKDH